MRPLNHLTPRYIADRLRLMAFEKAHPDLPWLTPDMVQILQTWLKPTDQALEWGSGRSTRWFATRVNHIISVEHNAEWYRRVLEQLESAGLDDSTDLRHVDISRQAEDAYISVVEGVDDKYLDFCLVDGLQRDRCALAALPKLRSGGTIVVDDVHRYLPSPTPTTTPDARTTKEGAATAQWAQFQEQVSQWRSIWTSSGVTDTAMWIKP